jgi:DNA-directed RNA polymerase subunit RPC12/RpoP
MSFLGSQEIDYKCPDCNRTVKFTLDDATKGKTKTCICGFKINLKADSSLSRSVRDFDKTLDSLDRMFK